ncbi:TonB-dependent receptor plug domain-containing protein [Helicobacter trogontum]|uniref:OMP2526 n=1 Tax=Helicobacter trogontum TaxID=50960 RepID=A0A1M4NI49_9HELI|nr:TonB-dependent receptor plug domain-containing protein [Helicobacter trogontum]TLD99216.1 TonB-dependent receptor [Helicobacter trogontum]SFZ72814.1 OMP2526 [Helicobacter trogontum]
MTKVIRVLPMIFCIVYGQTTTTDSDNQSLQMQTQDTQTKHTSIQERAVLSPVVAVSEWKRDSLYSSSNIELHGKDTLLHNGDVAKSILFIPGFSMTRKGGGGSEIYFRSQGASRLPIFLNGGTLNGACSARMDTTITYVFPENYNRINIYKGPQDVRYGALIAGGILFERDITRLKNLSFHAEASGLYGSFNRLDINANVIVGNKYGSLQAIVSHYSSDNYKAGGNKNVHSAYNRESVSLIGTITPTENVAIELDVDIGRGFASYADRGMDARTFDRMSYNLKYQQHFNETFDLLDIRAWYNDIDHIMDNFSHRSVAGNMGSGMGGMMGSYMLSNPKRLSIGGRVEGRFYLNDIIELYVGTNYNNDAHASNKSRMFTGANPNEVNAKLNTPYKPDFIFENAGVFTQGAYLPDSSFAIFFGARYDYMTTLHKSTIRLHNHLFSAFSRYEQYLGNATMYAGLGVAQRAPDVWERSSVGGMNLLSETNIQLDTGIVYKHRNYNAKISLFASYMPNYIALYYGSNTSVFNTNALLFGGEIEGEYIFLDSIHLYGSLAYTYGQNLTTYSNANALLNAGSPLPQIAPLQGQFSIFYDDNNWLLRFDVLFNAAQYRYALNFGNIVGKDFGASKAFATLNLYGGYTFKNITLLAGIDNITDTLYAYHLSKYGSDAILGVAPTDRIYEPGRSIWAKLKVTF